MAANLHRDTADLRFSVALHDHLEGPLPLFRDGLPSDLEVHIIAVIPATVGAAGLVGEGQFLRSQRDVSHPVQREDDRPVPFAHRVRRRNIGHIAGDVAYQVLIVNCIDLSDAGFRGTTLLSSVFLQIKSPYAVGELPGGKAAEFPADLNLIDTKHFFRAVMGIDDRRFFPAVAPAVLKDIYAKQLTLSIKTGCFKFPSHITNPFPE